MYRSRAMRRWFAPLAVLICGVVPLASSVRAASAFALPAFQQTWQAGEALAPNFWGPLATAHDGQNEPYKEGSLDFSESGPTNPGQGMRLVQYFDKARMELTHPASGIVTNGLLATEMITGKVQLGDATFQPVPSPAIGIAGDPDNPGPTYAGLASNGTSLFATTPAKPGTFVTLIAAADGSVTDGGGFAGISMSPAITGYDATTQHNVLGVFMDYRTRVGLPTIGLAIGEPFRANVKVAGNAVTVFVQVFERRVLTYTATNPEPFKVEMGNIGQHYYRWRYGVGSGASPPAPAPATAVTGTVTYLQRSALPPDAIVAVSLADVSRADTPTVVIASQTIPTNGSQVPFPFALAYDPAKIDATHSYAVSARITSGGQLLFISTSAYRVITRGNPLTVEIVVQPAS